MRSNSASRQHPVARTVWGEQNLRHGTERQRVEFEDLVVARLTTFKIVLHSSHKMIHGIVRSRAASESAYQSARLSLISHDCAALRMRSILLVPRIGMGFAGCPMVLA